MGGRWEVGGGGGGEFTCYSERQCIRVALPLVQATAEFLPARSYAGNPYNFCAVYSVYVIHIRAQFTYS